MSNVKKNELILTDWEIAEEYLLGINNDELVEEFLELFSSYPDSMADSKYVSMLNKFLKRINGRYICVEKLSVNEWDEIEWKFKYIG